jgi:hypothetical protein
MGARVEGAKRQVSHFFEMTSGRPSRGQNVLAHWSFGQSSASTVLFVAEIAIRLQQLMMAFAFI